MVGVEEGWVSVCWQRGWQSRVTKGKLGRTGRVGIQPEQAPFFAAEFKRGLKCCLRRVWEEWTLFVMRSCILVSLH